MKGLIISRVVLGTSDVVYNKRVCHGVVLSLPDVNMIKDFFPLPLGNFDVILGVKWLETLGEIKMN